MKNATISASLLSLLFSFFLFSLPVEAKDSPLQVVDWPTTGTPEVRLTFGKFRALPGMSSLHGYVMDTTAQNLTQKVIQTKRFRAYLMDKNNVRVGEDVIALSNVGPGEGVKFETTVTASGLPASISIQEIKLEDKEVTLTVNSAPQGAQLKIDGVDEGTTPRKISVGAGKHLLTFSKEGYVNGRFPLEISPDDVSGGSVSYELGAAANDTIEMRDGTVFSGDLLSISGMEVEVRIAGSIQKIDRNKIKRILLVQRDAPTPDLPAAASPESR